MNLINIIEKVIIEGLSDKWFKWILLVLSIIGIILLWVLAINNLNTTCVMELAYNGASCA